MGDVIKQMGDAVQAEGYAVGHLVKQVGGKDAAMKHALAASAQAESDVASMRARKEAAERECLAARERCRELEGKVHLAQEANARAASAEERLRAMYEAARASADAEVHMAEDHQILKIELRQAKAEALEHKHALSSSIRDQERMRIAAMDLASQLESLQRALGTPVALRCCPSSPKRAMKHTLGLC
jgi:DNA repair exonuclease SbcCD ATPase subunit